MQRKGVNNERKNIRTSQNIYNGKLYIYNIYTSTLNTLLNRVLMGGEENIETKIRATNILIEMKRDYRRVRDPASFVIGAWQL